MKKKKILMIVVVALLGSLLFAGGAKEFFTNAAAGTSTGAGIGAIIGSIIPGIGTAVGALVGSMLGFTGGAVVGGIEGSVVADAEDAQEKQDALDVYNAAMGRYNELDAMQDQTKLEILQGQANLNTFDEALARLPGAMNIQRQQLELQGQAQYSQLMNNWQGQELINAARGQSGGSAALIAQQQKAQVEMFAGKDLKLDLVGGMYANMMNEFELDNASQIRELMLNRSNAQEALNIHNNNLAQIQEELKKAQETVNKTKQNALDKGASI